MQKVLYCRRCCRTLNFCLFVYTDLTKVLDDAHVSALLHTVLKQISSAALIARQYMSQGSNVPPLGKWVQLRKSLDACGVVCMPLDRDPYRNVLCSRQSYFVRLRTLFWDDDKHYPVCTETSATVIETWHQQYISAEWLGSFREV